MDARAFLSLTVFMTMASLGILGWVVILRRQARSQTALFQTALEATADGILVLDEHERIVSYNHKFVEMWPVPQQILDSRENQQVLEHVQAQLKDPEAFMEKPRRSRSHPDDNHDDVVEFLDGRAIQRHYEPRRDGGKFAGRVCGFRDITAQRLAQASLEARTIVKAMKEFSHPGSAEMKAIDLNHAIESTLTISRNEWKYVADTATEFDPHLPVVRCLPGEFNQVILNLVVNAAHAIADVKTRGSEGIPEAVRGRIFTPFFTTKEVGRGTGQGLAIAHTVVVKKHGGTLGFETEEGKGTTFIIRLPIEGAPSNLS